MSVMTADLVSSATKTSTTPVTSQKTAEWMKLFPRQVTQSYTSSVVFMKQLTVIAVSTITYLKQIFPQESYMTETFGGVELSILKAKCKDEDAQFISTALIQSLEVLEKKYLDKLVLCLYEGPCHADNFVEAHSFEFSYSPGGVSMDVHSTGRDVGAIQPGRGAREIHPGRVSGPDAARYAFEKIRERTLDLLNACVFMSHTQRRENQEPYEVSLRLYYNDAAPAGYQAPGFWPMSAGETAESRDPVTLALADSAELGWVETPFHHLVARSYVRELASSHEANASANMPMMTQSESANIESEHQHESPVPREVDAPVVRCACGSKCKADDPPFITCDYCGTVQHAVCYGVRRGAAGALAQHCCTRCSDLEPGRLPTCPKLVSLPLKQRKSLCFYRRALEWTAGERSVSASSLADRFQLDATTAHKLTKHLHLNGVLLGAADDFNSSLKVDGERWNKMMSKHFQSTENTLVERLLAESLSQEITPDPVSNMLRPADRITLQNATTMGKIIQHSPPDTVAEDSTLKQYKDAIFSTDKHTDEELPLSGSHNPVKNIGKIGDKSVTKNNIGQIQDKTVEKRKIDTPNNKFWKSRLRTKKRRV